VVARHRVPLAALLPAPRGAGSACTRPRPPSRARRRCGPEQRARLSRIEYGCLPGRHDMARPAYRSDRVDRHHLTGDEPVEQMTDRGEPLLGARCRKLARCGLDPSGECTGCTTAIDGTPAGRAPGEEFIRGAGIGAPRVRVADVGREEFEEAHADARPDR